ncbi:hypothetical protein MKX03_030735 [Papaver bracteatum]|nr:hypothetical protein MKX03_030735 [Papaver bracteatum]
MPAEIVIASTRVIATNGLQVEDNKRYQVLDTVEEKRDIAHAHAEKYRARMARAYNQKVKPRRFVVGDLVLSISHHVPRNKSTGKFTPNWEGPFRVTEAVESGYYKIEHTNGTPIKGKFNDKINGKWLKTFYM